ncbi:MAG TPA: sigma-70 family RNA polymerase sigma factor [Candidatus Acidoferrales bacterium]|nr:sigma-70 family RNA polymerase sigma factor [Candidatus Acidoferrales bacterium]
MQGTQNATLSTTDSALVEMTRCGDKDAFGELIRRHQQKCVDLATFFLRNRGDAEDEAQNAFSKAYMHLDQYKGDAEFSTWLGRIVANQCLMLMRVRRNARFVYLDEPSSNSPRAQPVEVPSNSGDPEGELACRQMTDVLKKEIHRIPSVLRKVMLLRDIQELPMPEVAAQLGISVPAAKSRLLRARNELRSRLRPYARGMGNSSPLDRSAAPLNRVARHCPLRPAQSVCMSSPAAV